MSIAKLTKLLFGASPTLSRLSSDAKKHQELLHRVQRALPEQAAAHCLAASLRGDQLVLVTDSAAWATQIRFSEKALVAALARGSPAIPVTRLAVHVRATTAAASKSRPHPDTKISTTGRNAIKSCADSVKDPDLAEALRHLARDPAADPDQPE